MKTNHKWLLETHLGMLPIGVKRVDEIISSLIMDSIRIWALKKESIKLSHLVLDVDEGAHVQLLWEGHAVIEFNAVHSGVIKVEAFQLQSQQVWEMEESQTLETKKTQHKKLKCGTGIHNHRLWSESPCGRHISFCSAHRSIGWDRRESQAGWRLAGLLPVRHKISGQWGQTCRSKVQWGCH